MRTVVLGGYGFFGEAVARRLARRGFDLVIAGRSLEAAGRLASDLGARSARLDVDDPGFAHALAGLAPALVVHAAGPYRPGRHEVPRAAIEAGAHYVDLADNREFVCGIAALDARARAKGVLVASGASSVPALSAAVVDSFLPGFARLERIDLGIASSSRLPGLGTVRSVLACAGRPIPRWRDGRAGTAVGWASLRRHRFAHESLVRWLCDCDVPDLEIFPRRYEGVRDVAFGAGTGSALAQFGLRALAALSRAGLVRDPVAWARPLHGAGDRLRRFGDGHSAMFVTVEGIDARGARRTRRWELHAHADHGPQLPALAAVVVADKLRAGTLAARGAMPCVGLFTLAEWLAETQGLDVACYTD